MAASAWTVYSKAVLNISKKLLDLSADTLVVTLHTASYTPAPDTHGLWSDVSATELTTALGYTVGGLALASVTDTLTTATVTFDAADPTWPAFSAGPFRYAVITKRAAGALAAGDLLLCYSDLTGTGTIVGSGGAFTLTLNAAGIFTISHTP